MTSFRWIAHIHHIGSNWTLQPGVDPVAAKRQIQNLTLQHGPRIRLHSGGIQEVVYGLVDQTVLRFPALILGFCRVSGMSGSVWYVLSASRVSQNAPVVPVNGVMP
jgi:hypothetical protein